MLWEQHTPKGAMSPDAFWHEMSLPIFESQQQKEGEKVTDLLDDEKWGALEYCEHELLSVPLHWCHHFGGVNLISRWTSDFSFNAWSVGRFLLL